MGFFQHVLPCRLVDPGGFVCYNTGKGGIFLHKSIFDDYTFFDGSVNGENNILHSFFAGAGRTPF